jgi:uncharacterized zinc-type alcohol dehydrogenase-like protein
MTLFDIAGLVGVALILAGYAASTMWRLQPKSAASLLINFLGAGLILLSLTRAFNLSAAIVEGAWALIALVGLLRLGVERLARSGRFREIRRQALTFVGAAPRSSDARSGQASSKSGSRTSPMQAHAYAAQSAKTPLAPFSFERREPRPNDVAIDILFCGVCHSDLHTVRGEWGGVKFPSVPGHEIVGRVAAVGASVGKYKVGDMVAVGCMVDSCQHCDPCKRGLEQYCEVGMTGTYNGPEQGTGANTYGGYSDRIVVREEFVLRLPDGLDPAAAAPLLCAGITTYSPLRHWGAGPGKKVGVVGLGGLGHMAVKLAHAMGAEVTLFTTSPGKEADARRLGASHVVLSTDRGAMKAQARTCDLIINTVAVSMDLDPYINALALDGTMVLVGAPPSAHKSPAVFPFLGARRSMAGSGIGGIPETQEMLDFCAERGVASDIEIIPIQRIEAAYARMLKNDVKYRFVIDMQSLKDEARAA